jgi:hypothetical protein
VGLVQEIKPAAEIIREVAAQAEHILAVTLRKVTLGSSAPVCAQPRVSETSLTKSAREAPRKDKQNGRSSGTAGRP